MASNEPIKTRDTALNAVLNNDQVALDKELSRCLYWLQLRVRKSDHSLAAINEIAQLGHRLCILREQRNGPAAEVVAEPGDQPPASNR